VYLCLIHGCTWYLCTSGNLRRRLRADEGTKIVVLAAAVLGDTSLDIKKKYPLPGTDPSGDVVDWFT
jgi:hypothetical protein